jgi:DNA-binding XRE family transcriptional regulator
LLAGPRKGYVDNYHVYNIAESATIIGMLLIRITGCQLRAGRALAGLSIEDLAARAGLSRHSVSKWENSSHAVPEATVNHLSRCCDVLEAEGVRFGDDGGVFPLRRASAVAGTVLHSAASEATP